MSSESAAQSLPDAVAAWLQTVADTVRARNATYGDSAIDPIRVFSRASSDEQLRVRIDDKLSRVARGAGATPDTLVDLAGYIAILAVVQQRAEAAAAAQLCIPYVEDATPPAPLQPAQPAPQAQPQSPAADATACLRPNRAPVLVSSAMPDDDSYALTHPEELSPFTGVRSVAEAISVAGKLANGGAGNNRKMR